LVLEPEESGSTFGLPYRLQGTTAENKSKQQETSEDDHRINIFLVSNFVQNLDEKLHSKNEAKLGFLP
jgi:hypothetical protein